MTEIIPKLYVFLLLCSDCCIFARFLSGLISERGETVDSEKKKQWIRMEKKLWI